MLIALFTEQCNYHEQCTLMHCSTRELHCSRERFFFPSVLILLTVFFFYKKTSLE